MNKKPLFMRAVLGVVGVATFIVVIKLMNYPEGIVSYLSIAKTLLLVNLVCTLIMTGIIWVVQIVNYPLFSHIGEEQFVRYHEQHVWRITGVVALPMFFEAITSVLLLWYPYPNVPIELLFHGVLLIFLIWLSTLFLLVPQHDKLLKQYCHRAYARINIFNWVRTLAWTMRAVICINIINLLI